MDSSARRMALEFRLSLGLLALLAIAPLAIDNPYWLGVLIVSMYFALLAAGWNLLAGYTGQFSMAPACFAMIGAYTTGLLAYHLKIAPSLGIPASIGGVILLGAAEPLELQRGHRLVDAEPTSRIEPDQLIRIGRLLRRVVLRQASGEEDHVGAAEECEPRPQANIAFIAAGAGVWRESDEIRTQPLLRRGHIRRPVLQRC